jgi:hypothetical protein
VSYSLLYIKENLTKKKKSKKMEHVPYILMCTNQAQLIKEIKKKKNIMSGTIITVKNKLKKMCGTTIN